MSLREEMTRKDRQRLQAVKALHDGDHEAWNLLDDPELAFTVFNLLVATR